MIDWYIRIDDDRIEGPFSEAQIKYGIDSGKITSRMRIRQQQGTWASPQRVRTLFQQLSEKGFFLKDISGHTFGPFTKQRVLEFEASKQLPPRYWIRRGTKDDWTEIDNARQVAKRTVAKQAVTKQAVTKQAVTKPTVAKPTATEAKSRPEIPVGIAVQTPTRFSKPMSYPTRAELIEEIAEIPGAKSHQSRPAIPAAPVMKLRGNSVVDRIIDLSERVESVFLGSPLASG